MVDKSSRPRSTEDLKKAVQVVERSIIIGIFKLPPELAIQLTTIREGLLELIERRAKDARQ